MTPLKRSPAEKRLFLAELRAGRQSALRRLRAALRASGGSAPQAAKGLGIGVQTLYRARAESPAVRRVLDRHSLGQAETARRRMLAENPRKNGGAKEKSEIDL